jgi:hypothetical protein
MKNKSIHFLNICVTVPHAQGLIEIKTRDMKIKTTC